MLLAHRCLLYLLAVGDLARALDHLDRNRATVVDQLSWQTKHAKLLVKMGKFNEARQAWGRLVADQPDNYRFLTGLQTAHLELSPEVSEEMFALKNLELPSTTLNLSVEQRATLAAVHRFEKFRSQAASKIVVSLLEGEEFRTELDSYLRLNLHKAVPSLYADVSALVRKPHPTNAERLMLVSDMYEFRLHPITAITLSIVDGYISCLKSQGTFSSSSETQEPPTSLLWSLFLKAHLLDKSGRLQEALEVIDECLQHTPTALDIHIKKARILRKLGDPLAAAEIADTCRTLDLQDRYLNNKATKYLLRAGEVSRAMDTIAMFTKHEGDPQYALFELQCSWYEVELADAYARMGKYGLALKKYYDIRKHYETYVEDQYDFHNYCIRRTTLRAYLDTLCMTDSIHSQKLYQRTVRGVLRVCLTILDRSEVGGEAEDESGVAKDEDHVDLSHLTPAERKKEKARLRKLRKKQEEKQESVVKAETESHAKKDTSGEREKPARIVAPFDDDPQGEKLLDNLTLDEAASFCLQVQRLKTCDSDTHALIAQIMLRRGKLISTIRSISAGLRWTPDHPECTHALVMLAAHLADLGKDEGGSVVNLVREELSILMGGSADVNRFVLECVERAKSLSILHRIYAAKSLVHTKGNSELAISLLLSPDALLGQGVTYANALEAHRTVLVDLKNKEKADELKTRILEAFPYSRSLGDGYDVRTLEQQFGIEGGVTA